MGYYSGDRFVPGKRFSPPRWKFIKRCHTIEPCHCQIFVAIYLYTPHYQVGVGERKRYLKVLENFVSKNDNTDAIIYRKEEDW
eukprot:3699327-Ditylum_brightwellii.AAC.1